jgi:hypothetical protein
VIGYQDLRNGDMAVFAKDAAKWQQLAGSLTDRGNDVASAINGLSTWTGTAADAARTELTGHRDQFADMAATVAKIPAILTGLATQIRQLRPALDGIVGQAQRIGCQVHSDGAVSYDPTLTRHAPIGQEDMGSEVA